MHAHMISVSLPSVALPEPEGVTGTSSTGAIAGGTIGAILVLVTLAVAVVVVVKICRR